MLTDDRLEELKREVALRGRGLDPDYTPLQEEADSFSYAQENNIKTEPVAVHGGGGSDDVGFLDNINSAISSPTPMEDLRKYESKLDQVNNIVI